MTRVVSGFAILLSIVACVGLADVTSGTRVGDGSTTTTVPFTASLSSPDGIVLLLNASRGSKLEACGCRGHNMGGIDKEGTMIEGFRKVTPAVLALEGGGVFREFMNASLKLQSYYLLRGLSMMRYDVVNVGYTELAQGLERVRQLGEEFALPLISANIIDRTTSEPVFAAYKSFELTRRDGKKAGVTVVGVTAPNAKLSHANDKGTASPDDEPSTAARHAGRGGAETEHVGGGNDGALEFATGSTTAALSRKRYVIADEVTILKPLVAKLRADADVLVLLAFDGPERTKQIVEQVPGFDLAVAGDYFTHVQPFRAGEKQTWVAPMESGGKMLGVAECKPAPSGGLAVTEPNLIVIEEFYPSEPKLLAVMEAYSRSMSKLPGSGGIEPTAKLYTGASRCSSCHAPEYTQWRGSRHWRALATLTEKQMQYNPDCLRCHTVAYGLPGGFRDLRVTAYLSGVQCESCHGPGAQHVSEENQRKLSSIAGETTGTRTARMRMKFDAEFCMECHDADNDSKFDFATRMQAVKHKP